MAVRGINVVEKHIEKILLGAAVAGLAGVVMWQYAGTPTSVEVNSVQVPLDQAYPKIEEMAKRLQGQMHEANPGTPAAITQHVNLLDGYKSKLTSNVAPSPTMWAPKGYELKGIEGPEARVAGQFYQIPTLPTTTKATARAFMSTVDANEVAAYPGLAELMNGATAAPYDKAAVSVETTFNPAALLEALKSDPDGGGPAQALLQHWWIDTEIVAVNLVRQEMGASGQWGAEEVLQGMPGRVSYKDRLANPALTSAELGEVINLANQNAEELLRPEWYKRASLGGAEVGEEWMEPAKAGDGAGMDNGAGGDEMVGLLRQRKELIDRINRFNKSIDAEEKAPAPKNNPGGGGGGGGGGGKRPGGGGAGGGGGLGGGAGGQPVKDARQEHIDSLKRSRDKAQKDLDAVNKKITDKGGKIPGGTITPDPAKPTPAAVPTLLKTTDAINIWAHDVSAKRGSVYRYQVRLLISNPVFNKPAQLRDQDKALASSPTVTVPAADWSDPVRVDDKLYYFIVGAQGTDARGTGGGTAMARAELYYFTWGFWRKTEVGLEPGDPIAGTVQVPDATKIAAGPTNPGNPVAPAGPGKRPVLGGEPAPVPVAGAAAAPVGIPMMDMPVERDAFLLDVPQNPISEKNVAGSKTTWAALVRDEGGLIVLRDPQMDKATPLFKRLESSASAGKKFGAEGGPAPAPGGNQPPNGPGPMVLPGRG